MNDAVLPNDDNTKRGYGESSDGAAADHDSGPVGTSAPEQGYVDSTQALGHRLIIEYSNALDFINAQSAIVFLSHRSVPQQWLGRDILFPRANFVATILAEAHIADRVDALIRRGQRFRALNPGGNSPLNLDRLQDFRSSLSPVKRRTVVLWVVLLALVVAFPVAWITDYLSVLAPKAIVCSSPFSFRYFIAKLTGAAFQPVAVGCRVHSGPSLVEALVRVAHLNITPGGVIDTVLSIRTRGFAVVLLLVIVLILCLCVVLLAFRSGFRLKRLAFSVQQETPGGRGSLLGSGIDSSGLYSLECKVFTSVGLRCPREFPLDLAVSAGMVVLPLTIATDLLVTATLPKLDLVTAAELAVVAAGLIVTVLLRLHWLARIWRSRVGLKAIEPRERWLPDGTTVLVRGGVYGAILLAIGYVIWVIVTIGTVQQSVTARVLEIVIGVPFLIWPFSMLWWYRLHRELAAYGRCIGLPVRPPAILSLVPPIAIAVAIIIVAWAGSPQGLSFVAFGILILIGFIGCPADIYIMGGNLQRLRCHGAPNTAGKARAAGLRSTAMLIIPGALILYFQHSLNQIWREIATPTPQHDDAPGVSSIPMEQWNSSEAQLRGNA